jgi:hypothetical protein
VTASLRVVSKIDAKLWIECGNAQTNRPLAARKRWKTSAAALAALTPTSFASHIARLGLQRAL